MKKNDTSLKIGNIELDNPFIAAPMAGVTDSAFRSIVREMGAALTCTEMVSAKGLLYGNKKTEDLLHISSEEGPVSFQIFGREPDIMGRAAESLYERKNAFLDINMGCPVPKVVKNGEGSALLRDLDQMHSIIREVTSRAKKPVTVKLRTGWDRDHIVAVEAARCAEDAGASAIALHGRTREQFYEGKADWKLIAEVKKAVNIPVIGNGDVFFGEDAIRMMNETGCDFVLIARGMLGNPWIFTECVELWKGNAGTSKPSKEDKIKIMLLHLGRLVAIKGEKVAVREMRKHFGWYTKGVPGAAEKRRQVNSIDSIDELRNMIESI